MNIQNYLKEWESAPGEWGKSDCLMFIKEYLNKRFPKNKLIDVNYKSLRGAIKIALTMDWIEELNKVFKVIEIDKIVDGDLFLERKERTIPSIYLYFQDFLYSVFPGLGFYKIKLSDVKDVGLKHIHIEGVK